MAAQNSGFRYLFNLSETVKTKILYIEDEPFLSKIVRESLESRGFDVCWTGDGEEAVSAFKQFQPDICVLDVMLPNRDGFAIGQDIRRINPRVPIIYLTAKSQTEDVVKGFESGGNDYLRKPFSLEELIARIQNLLNMVGLSRLPAQQPNSTNGIPIGRYRFFPVRQRLQLDEQERALSHRETQLLHLLIGQQNQVVQRKDILLQLWGDDSFFNSRNLDVYITRLRDYLKEDAGVQILTLKAVGYRLVCS